MPKIHNDKTFYIVNFYTRTLIPYLLNVSRKKTTYYQPEKRLLLYFYQEVSATDITGDCRKIYTGKSLLPWPMDGCALTVMSAGIRYVFLGNEGKTMVKIIIQVPIL